MGEMKCPFCPDGSKIPIEDVLTNHIIILEFMNGNIHVHAPLENPAAIKRMIEKVKERTQVDAKPPIQTE